MITYFFLINVINEGCFNFLLKRIEFEFVLISKLIHILQQLLTLQ